MDEFDIVDSLILSGGLEFAGSDPETGEPLYRPTEKLKDIDSRLNEEISVYFSEVTLGLWQKGFLDMDITLEDPIVKLAPKSFNSAEIMSLKKDERIIMQEIIKTLSNKK